MLLTSVNENLRRYRRHEHLARAGTSQDKIFLVKEGWAFRYSMLSDGRRQITGLFLPGDYCEPGWMLSGRAELPIVALTETTVTEIPLNSVHSRPGENVKLILGALLSAFNRQNEWIIRLGRKSATEKVACLFHELYDRLNGVERGGARCSIPLTQQHIADIVGLTPVHVNRVLADLRKRGVVVFSGKTLTIPEPDVLAAMAHAA